MIRSVLTSCTRRQSPLPILSVSPRLLCLVDLNRSQSREMHKSHWELVKSPRHPTVTRMPHKKSRIQRDKRPKLTRWDFMPEPHYTRPKVEKREIPWKES